MPQPHLGVSALSGATANQQKAYSAPAPGASPPGPAELPTESQADADPELTQTDPAERVVGH